MPRLDAERLGVWRAVTAACERLSRAVDADLMEECGISLDWFEVLSALQRAGGSMRVAELVDELAAVPSSMSRRLDRLEEAGWVERRRGTDPDDARAVVLVLTRAGRDAWREANVVHRRAVQRHFARHLTDSDLLALGRVLGKISYPQRG